MTGPAGVIPARAAYGLLGHHADAEDAVQNGCFKLIMARAARDAGAVDFWSVLSPVRARS